MRSVCSAMHQQQLGAGLAGNHPLRALVCGAYFVQRFRVRAPPSPPGGAGKTGGRSRDGLYAMTHSLLRLPAKHRPAQRKFNASSTRYVFRAFPIVRVNQGISYIFW